MAQCIEMKKKCDKFTSNVVYYLEPSYRALAPLFGNGAGAFRIGKNSVILTKIGKNQNVLCMKLLMLN